MFCLALFTLFASLVANQAHPTPRERSEEEVGQNYEKAGRENTTRGSHYSVESMMHYAILSEKKRREGMSICLLVGWFELMCRVNNFTHQAVGTR